jgi:hypothetical protein
MCGKPSVPQPAAGAVKSARKSGKGIFTFDSVLKGD